MLTNLLEKAREHGIRDTALIEHAYTFAAEAHRSQKRKSGEPYITHPAEIAARLLDLNMDQATIAAALLHDVPENAAIPIERIKKEFGDDVAFLVAGVTKLDKLRYHGIERMAESLRKMFFATAEDIRVVVIKLMDRLHNMETLKALPEEKQKRIALETLEIFSPLADRLGFGEMKARLEDLAFPYVHPEEHKKLELLVKDAFRESTAYIKNTTPILREMLEKEAIPFLDIDARAKHRYSLWRKLQKFNGDLEKIYDLVALRVIVPDVGDCYQALGAIHAKWRPLPGKIKDYIALPKPNGYRSLHTTVFGPEGRIFEIQIRTREMHEAAEHGIAAHWAYSAKKGGKEYREKRASFANKKELGWIKDLKNWQKEVRDSEEFLNSLKIDFFKHRIFALTPKGDVIDLPEGATALDFAYHVHSKIGDTATGAKINGKMTPLHHELANNDVVEIITQKNKTPSSDWLAFVKTSIAKHHIASTLRKADEAKRFSGRQGQTIMLRVVAKEHKGMHDEFLLLMRSFKAAMKHSNIERGERTNPLFTFTIQIKSPDDLRKLVLHLKQIKGVEEVNYKILP